MHAQGHQPGFDELLMQTGRRSGQADDVSSILSSRRTSQTRTQIAPAGPHPCDRPLTPLTTIPSHRAWPAQREVRGLLTLKASPTHSNGMCAECSVQNDVLTLSIARAAGSRESSGTVVAVPLQDLAVGLKRGRTDMFIIATRNGDQLYDDISCFADDEEKRNKWIAVLRRMGVPIFDLSSSDGRNTVGCPVVF